MGRNQFLNKHQFLRMSREELERKWKTQKLMEQEEILLMEAKARALQYIASSAAGGSTTGEPEIVTFDLGAVLFLDTTWKYLYLDYENGTISEPVDTQIPGTYQYYIQELSGPIQDKGLVYALSDVQDPFGSGDLSSLSIFYIGINGEIVDIKYLDIDPEGLSDDSIAFDGVAHMCIENDGLSSIVSIFNGTEIITKEYQVPEEYDFMLISAGSAQDFTSGGRVFFYKIYFTESDPVLVEVISTDPLTGQEITLLSEDVFSLGNPVALAYYPGNVFYLGFENYESEQLSELRGYNVDSGSMIFNVDLISEIPGSVVGISDYIFYGKNNMQVIIRYDDGISEKGRIYNFNGDTGGITTQEVEGFSDFDDVVIRRSTFDPYVLHLYTESEGIANIFYAGTPSEGVMTVPDLCSIYYLPKGGSSYQTYILRASGDPERSINLNWGADNLSIGRDIYVEADLGDEFGLSGNLSLVNLGSTVNVIEDVATTDIMEGLALLPSGDNSLYLIPQTPLLKALLLGPDGVLIDEVVDDVTILRISGDSGFLFAKFTQYYWNSSSSGFQELNGFKNADEPEYATPNRMMSGDLIIFNSELSPVNYLLVSKDSVGNPSSFEQDPDGEIHLGKSTFLYRTSDPVNNLYLYDFSGNLLQSYEEGEDPQILDSLGMIGNKFLAIRRVPEENRVDILIGSSAGITKSTINGFDYQIIPMINDVIWFDQNSHPDPPATILYINAVANTVSEDSLTYTYDYLRTDPGDVIEIKIGPDSESLASEPVYDTIPVESQSGSGSYIFDSGDELDPLQGSYIGLFGIDYAGNPISSSPYQIPNSQTGIYLIGAETSSSPASTDYTYKMFGGMGDNQVYIQGSFDSGLNFIDIDLPVINSSDGTVTVTLDDVYISGASASGVTALVRIILVVDPSGASVNYISNTIERTYP